MDYKGTAWTGRTVAHSWRGRLCGARSGTQLSGAVETGTVRSPQASFGHRGNVWAAMVSKCGMDNVNQRSDGVSERDLRGAFIFQSL